MSALGQKRTSRRFIDVRLYHSKSGHLIGASWDYPFFMNRRTCSTGQSLLALITRTREVSLIDKRVGAKIVTNFRNAQIGGW